MANPHRTTSSRGVCGCGKRFNRGAGHAACFDCRAQTPSQRIEDADPRAAAMAAAYRDGSTLQAVAREYGLSAERVRQMLRMVGVTRQDGGQSVLSRRRAAEAEASADLRCIEKYGHTKAEHMALLARGREYVVGGGSKLRTPVYAFRTQRKSARGRGIAWRLTFGQWWRVWSESGKWELRGRGHGHYVMSRRGDVGPYEVGNVFIQMADLNNSTGPHKKSALPMGVQRLKDRGKDTGRYFAQSRLNGRVRYLGSFDTVDAASAAYQSAQEK